MERDMRECKIHGLTLHSKYKGGSGGSSFVCHECNVQAVHRRRKRLKQMAVEYKGGCCSICGYNKCIEAMDFHHKDPSLKEFGISSKGTTRSFEKLKNELDKCILVCRNCHAEIHIK